MTDLDQGGPKILRIRIYNIAGKHGEVEPAIVLKYVLITSISKAQPLQEKMPALLLNCALISYPVPICVTTTAT